MSRTSWKRVVTLLVAPLFFVLAGLVAIAMPAQAAPDLVSVETSCVEGVSVTFTNISDGDVWVGYGSPEVDEPDDSFTFGPGESKSIQTDRESFYYAANSDPDAGEEPGLQDGELDLSDVCESDENGEEPNVEPVTIADCKVTVPALQGVSYFQDKGNDPMLDPGVYDAKHFYPSTTFTAHLGTQDNPKLGEWAIDVPEKCAPASEEPVDDPVTPPADDPVSPAKAPAAGL